MVTVEVRSEGIGWACEVRIDTEGRSTRHLVHVRTEDLRRWSRAGEPPEQLVRRAFEFLLARESPDQVLRSFQLADIQRYFPEFDAVMSMA